jgi:hypothetical protein
MSDTMDTEEGGKELAERVSRYLKAELKKANVTYETLAERLKAHGFKNETLNSIKSKLKLKRGTFTATFFVVALLALKKEGLRLEDI